MVKCLEQQKPFVRKQRLSKKVQKSSLGGALLFRISCYLKGIVILKFFTK